MRGSGMGRVIDDEWRAKIAAGVRLAYKEGRAGGFRLGNRCGAQVKNRQKVVAAAVAVTAGAGGFGRMRIGRADHVFAKRWEIESPEGETFAVENLRAWCREEAERFPAEPGSKTPGWSLAASGLSGAVPGNRYGRESWRGWRVLMVSESTSV